MCTELDWFPPSVPSRGPFPLRVPGVSIPFQAHFTSGFPVSLYHSSLVSPQVSLCHPGPVSPHGFGVSVPRCPRFPLGFSASLYHSSSVSPQGSRCVCTTPGQFALGVPGVSVPLQPRFPSGSPVCLPLQPHFLSRSPACLYTAARFPSRSPLPSLPPFPPDRPHGHVPGARSGCTMMVAAAPGGGR